MGWENLMLGESGEIRRQVREAHSAWGDQVLLLGMEREAEHDAPPRSRPRAAV